MEIGGTVQGASLPYFKKKRKKEKKKESWGPRVHGDAGGWLSPCRPFLCLHQEMTVCRPIKRGGLGVFHIHSMNTTRVTKWVDWIMGPQDDLLISVLQDSCGRGLNWESLSASIRGALPFWQGLQPLFSRVRNFFSARLGDSSVFRYWLDAWSTLGILRESFPSLFPLT